MKGICEVCKSEKNVRFYQKKQVLCGKHREQMRRFGKIRERTMADKNYFCERNHQLEMIIYDRRLKEKGRALINKKDWMLVESYGSWCIDGSGYVVNGKNGGMKLHQLIMGKKEGFEIDHRNLNKLDNRRQNLRFISHQENCFNYPKNRYKTT